MNDDDETLKRGADGSAPSESRPKFHTPTIITGPSALPNVDNIAEVIAWAEREDYR
jgi:hypothetical protein